MARQSSKGTCTFCHKEFSKASMVRHLASCEQRTAMQTESGSHQKRRKSRTFHLVVEARHLPMYWMHLEVAAETTLATLDRFFRDTWLECCGHLSVFRIGGFNYYVDAETNVGWDWDPRRKNMQAKLEEVFTPGQICSYEYDFGSTTELVVKVVAEHEVDMKRKPIQVLARNIPPLVPCDVCGKPAAHICPQCIYEDKGCLCDVCVKNHECDEEILLPLVNSPRAGVCGYTGQDRVYIW